MDRTSQPPSGDIAAWRQAQRRRLLDHRNALNTGERKVFTTAIIRNLQTCFRNPEHRVFALYWPIRGEPDLRPWMRHLHAQGVSCALPAVVGKNLPLRFYQWTPGCAIRFDQWKIGVPQHAAVLEPDTILAPLVGFDDKNYRLGYGGGFFDRTFAGRRVLKVGVGYEQARLSTIYPQPHDVAMDIIVSEAGVFSNSE